MTREALVNHLQNNGCQASPIEGINITGWQMRFVNKRDQGKYAYLDMPINSREVPQFAVERACLILRYSFATELLKM